jgi:hypothetical protein
MSKDKAKSGTGRGTGKKGWTRWEKGANKAKSNKPYKSKQNKQAEEAKADNTNKSGPSEWIDG